MAADVETEGAALWADTWQRAHNLAGATLALGGLSLDDIDSDAFERCRLRRGRRVRGCSRLRAAAMSMATLQAVEDAIAAHLADEYDEPWLVTHWYAIACASDADMERTNYVHMAPDAPLHTSLGLIRVADNRLVALIGADDEDDR